MKLTVGWLYPDLMNIYGDRGNILTLLKRAEWRGYEAKLIERRRGTSNQSDEVDIFFFGGGQDREQALGCDDLRDVTQPPLEATVNRGAGVEPGRGGDPLADQH